LFPNTGCLITRVTAGHRPTAEDPAP